MDAHFPSWAGFAVRPWLMMLFGRRRILRRHTRVIFRQEVRLSTIAKDDAQTALSLFAVLCSSKRRPLRKKLLKLIARAEKKKGISALGKSAGDMRIRLLSAHQ